MLLEHVHHHFLLILFLIMWLFTPLFRGLKKRFFSGKLVEQNTSIYFPYTVKKEVEKSAKKVVKKEVEKQLGIKPKRKKKHKKKQRKMEISW
ncbi:MAG: hypothetical protein ACUVXA_08135 [Candidatus Jordarchaeum sp.]|uniref:hypothetical protein n=1 Tax=Candidatus Jordarchaeum sp. TaxID=2823881 RepID=UPI00404AA817